MNTGEVIICQTDDGLTQINLVAIEGAVWLTQEEIADRVDEGGSTITKQIQKIFSDKELSEDSVCRNFRRTAEDGKKYNDLHYNLVMTRWRGFGKFPIIKARRD